MTLILSSRARLASAVLLLLASSCRQERPKVPLPPVAARVDPSAMDGFPSPGDVRTTIVTGSDAMPVAPQTMQIAPRSGDVTLNFPSADVHLVAKAVLGDLLHIGFTIDPAATATVTVMTVHPIAKSSVLAFFETALHASNLALAPQNGGYLITPIAGNGAAAPIATEATGYGTEQIALKFVNAEEMKRLIESVLPGTVSSTDADHNLITIAGTTGQRAGVRDILRQFDVDWLRNMSFALLVPERTDARLIVPELDKLINDPQSPTRGLVRLIAMDKLNGILAITAQRQYLDDVRRWVDILDREGESSERRLFVYHVQNGRARDIGKVLSAAFGIASGDSGEGNADPFAQQPTSAPPPTQQRTSTNSPSNANAAKAGVAGGGPVSGTGSGGCDPSAICATITADETNNAIVVYGTPREYAVIEDALRKLDVLPYQVMIEAAITEVTLTDELRYGVQWNFQTGSSNFALSEGTSSTVTRTFPGFSYFYGGNSISAALNALEQRTNIKVISAPKVLVLNNQTAALQVGDEVPISTQSQVSTVTVGSPVINSIEYRDTGVILKVTPRVNSGGLVLLDVSQEVSAVSAAATSGINSPTISTRRISTSVAVQDGQVIALGGLFKDSKTFGKNGLPLLSRIPILGAFLFGNTDNVQNRTELLVLLKPHVLRTIDDGREVTEELRAKLRTLEPFRTQGKIP